MQDHNLVLLKVPNEFVGLGFGLGKDDGSVLRVEPLDELDHSLVPLLLFNHQGIVLDCLGSSYIFLPNQIYLGHVFEVAAGNFGNPRRNRS